MPETVYIFGHKNPDTDSICSAIAYAHLKNQLDPVIDYKAIALGKPSHETRFILDKAYLDVPDVMTKLPSRVSDLAITPVDTLKETDSLKKAFETITRQPGRSLPVVDAYEHLIGVVSISDIMPYYLNMEGTDILRQGKTPFENLVQAFNLKTYQGTVPSGSIEGAVRLFDDLDEGEMLKAEDVLLCNAKVLADGRALDTGAGHFIVANVEKEEQIEAADGTGAANVFYTDMSLCSIMKVINQTVPVGNVVRKKDLEYFMTYETIDDVKENMLTSKFTHFPVVNEEGFVRGIISMANLIDYKKRKVILVDHNEANQSIDGIEELNILEVIDHHRIANINTVSPLFFRAEPVGCTSTIVAKMYLEKNVPIPKAMAVLMLSAILSDTLIFKSPTCTPEDEAMARMLAVIANLDISMHGMQVIQAGSTLEHDKIPELVNADMKRFAFGKYRVMISQIYTSDFDGFYHIYDAVVERMEELCETQGFDLSIVMVTDVVVGGTELIAVGEARWIAENAFKMGREDKSIFLADVFSRKKQVVPALMQAARL